MDGCGWMWMDVHGTLPRCGCLLGGGALWVYIHIQREGERGARRISCRCCCCCRKEERLAGGRAEMQSEVSFYCSCPGLWWDGWSRGGESVAGFMVLYLPRYVCVCMYRLGARFGWPRGWVLHGIGDEGRGLGVCVCGVVCYRFLRWVCMIAVLCVVDFRDGYECLLHFILSIFEVSIYI